MLIGGFRMAMHACQDARYEEGSASDCPVDLPVCAYRTT